MTCHNQELINTGMFQLLYLNNHTRVIPLEHPDCDGSAPIQYMQALPFLKEMCTLMEACVNKKKLFEIFHMVDNYVGRLLEAT